jgi:hypothetical protein
MNIGRFQILFRWGAWKIERGSWPEYGQREIFKYWIFGPWEIRLLKIIRAWINEERQRVYLKDYRQRSQGLWLI